MLFNSPQFLFVFLPITFGLFLLAGRLGRIPALSLLTVASFIYYGWGEPQWVFALIALLFGDYLVARQLRRKPSRLLMWVAIAANLGLLGYLKYTGFVVENINAMAGGKFIDIAEVVLPIGISFFTFQQIAYIVDSQRGEVIEHDFFQYAAFITFFPHFIAGPILNHRDMLPQLSQSHELGAKWSEVVAGGVIFTIGLAKKLLIADHIEIYASPVFDAARDGVAIGFVEAWCGALAYAFQIYFDFSGYSDMAIGLGRMFGLTLPINFNAPYKATSIVDFWRRWHISLSRFLRDYLYVPLGGNRLGPHRRYVNLMAVMLLGGLWHGAGWGFILWGGLHGLFLAVNHAWTDRFGEAQGNVWFWRGVTFLLIVVAWVPFRAESFGAVAQMWSGMAGFNGFMLAPTTLDHFIFIGSFEVEWLLVLLAVCWFVPNSREIMERYQAASQGVRGGLVPLETWLAGVGVLLLISLPMIFERRPFLYFQF